MARTIIMADSTVDLPRSMLDDYGIIIIPLYVTLDGASLQDGVNITPEDMYAYIAKTNKIPKTSAATIVDFTTAFEPHIAAGNEIVYIGISEKISATVTQAQIAAKELSAQRIHVVDGRSLSTGTALSVLKASELAREGKSAAEIESRLMEFIPRVRTSFVLDTLTYLYYGGRCSAIQTVGAKLLKIKPRIDMIDGEMSPTEKYRGSISHAARQYTLSILKNVDRIDPERAFITYTQGTDASIIAAVREEVERVNHFKEIIETVAGCVITNHCGRDTIGLLYLER
ncbi:MAG: DegV family protein [Oscillospiraceae bacterium]|jgi:DegV family protein with EDD domain|nr:DegV family protein [Oscillospiraceae bacterium]